MVESVHHDCFLQRPLLVVLVAGRREEAAGSDAVDGEVAGRWCEAMAGR